MISKMLHRIAVLEKFSEITTKTSVGEPFLFKLLAQAALKISVLYRKLQTIKICWGVLFLCIKPLQLVRGVKKHSPINTFKLVFQIFPEQYFFRTAIYDSVNVNSCWVHNIKILNSKF